MANHGPRAEPVVRLNVKRRFDDEEDPLDGGALVSRSMMYANVLYGAANAALFKPVQDTGIVIIWALDPSAENCSECI
jgi:hypothetical protein